MDLERAMAFVRPGTKAVLTTLRADGRPQLSNVVYAVADDGSIRVSVTERRAKTVNMRRDPRVCLHVTDESFWQYVVLDGEARLGPVTRDVGDPGSDMLVDYYRRVNGEHPDWDDYRRAMVEEGRLVAVVTPTRAYGQLQT
ncbi:MAG: PPOX class F420-dependent oxidoreductase [Pseudonocardia sp.]|nr:PPOX class F420-dependent oxidoreductase [Pseudonocardia sp.]